MVKRGIFLILIFAMPLAYSISIKELITRYSFTTLTPQIYVTGYADFMIDKNNNEINDTLIIELATNNTAGTFIFVINIFEKNGIVTNETEKILSQGVNKLNITFDSIFLAQNQFNYSIKIYNSTYSLKYRKDNILTQSYSNYEQRFNILGIKDSKAGKTLEINITINSSLNGIFETALFLTHNNSVISVKENKSISNSTQDLIYKFYNETIKRTHYIGNFNISSFKIGKKIIKTDFITAFYDFRDFAIAPYIFNFTDNGVDVNGNNKHDSLQLNASIQIMKDDSYAFTLELYDLLGNIAEIKNIPFFLGAGKNIVTFNINGSRIYGKKLNGPFIIKYIGLFENGTLIEQINDAYITKNYNFNDFDYPNLPDLSVSISVSEGYHYGISNITINFTFKNIGNNPAFNVFTEIFDNKTFSKNNKSSILDINSEIFYQINFTNISDIWISAVADLQDFVEELNESNNAERIIIKLNKRPSLALINNITANETDKIVVNLSAYDPNSDNLSFAVNSSRFSKILNIFQWDTTTTDSGNYTLSATVSDGFLNDTVMFKIIVLDTPEKDIDNDGVNDSIDNLIGNGNSVNTSTINITIFLDNSRNLSSLFNESKRVKFMENNLTIAEFNFDFSIYKLNLANITINRQTGNATGSLLFRGLKMPEGTTKTLYIDKINARLDGVCIKEGEVSAINEISSNCNSDNEFKVECDGTLQSSYICTYNLTLDKYKVQGLKHSGIIQIDYTKPLSQSTVSISAGSGSGGGSGGSSGDWGSITCNSNWQCNEWTECIDGFKNRKCFDTNQCNFPANKPVEVQQCILAESKTINVIKPKQNILSNKFSGFSSITGSSVKLGTNEKLNIGVVIILMEVLIIVGVYLIIKNQLQSN